MTDDYEEKLPKKADLQISPSGLILLNHTMDIVLQCSVFTLVIFKYKVWKYMYRIILILKPITVKYSGMLLMTSCDHWRTIKWFTFANSKVFWGIYSMNVKDFVKNWKNPKKSPTKNYCRFFFIVHAYIEDIQCVV